MRKAIILAALTSAFVAPRAEAASFVNALSIANGTDLSTGLGAGVNGNRLGGFGSDLVYRGNEYFGLTDRGPGGGLLSFTPRIQVFGMDTSHTTGAISNFGLKRTVVFTQADGKTPFNGLNPQLLSGSKSVLGASFDPEGLVIRANGNFMVADEYGPSLYEFDPEGLVIRANGNFMVADEYGPSLYEFDSSGRFVRSYAPPANLLPTEAGGATNYVDGRGTITSGRQDNRGFEGLTLSNDGTKAYAILQDPLVNEGQGGDGRRGRFVRMVEFDLATGNSKQYAYQLESIADINTRTGTPFSATNQGRSIGVSSIIALPNGKFMVLERDNRGLGVDETTAVLQSGTKRVFVIDITGATDISGMTLTNGQLPNGVVAVTKDAAPFLDIIATVGSQAVIAEKLEGLAFGDRLADGGINLLVASDNDFSVTQINGPDQFDVCTNGTVFENVALDAACRPGLSTIPTLVYSFRLTGAEAQAFGFAPVPEPAAWAMMIAGFGLVGGLARRRVRFKSVLN